MEIIARPRRTCRSTRNAFWPLQRELWYDSSWLGEGKKDVTFQSEKERTEARKEDRIDMQNNNRTRMRLHKHNQLELAILNIWPVLWCCHRQKTFSVGGEHLPRSRQSPLLSPALSVPLTLVKTRNWLACSIPNLSHLN